MGLDLSLSATGVCIVSGEKAVPDILKTYLIKTAKASGVKERILRLQTISSEICGYISEYRPDVVVIEDAARNQVYQAAAIGELHGVVKKDIFVVHGIVPVVAQATHMRSLVVGKIERSYETFTDSKGRIKKRMSYGTIPGKGRRRKKATIKDMIEIHLKGEGLSFASQDEMDAYVCARFGWQNARS